MSRTAVSVETSTGNSQQPIELEPVQFPASSTKGSRTLNDTEDFATPNDVNISSEVLASEAAHAISKRRAVVIIASISCISLIQAMLGGILIVSLPTMAHDIGLSGNLLLWPAAVNSLACGCTLLLSGSIADVVGGRKVFLIGEFFLIVTTIACGVCRTGIEVILFRAFQGVALSLCLPSSVSLITKNIPIGTYRNAAFACLGAGQPLGFSVGLVLGGVLVGSIGWRYGYYIGAILTFLIWVVSVFSIPKDLGIENQTLQTQVRRMTTEIDWIGCGLLSISLGMFSYVFSVLAGGSAHFLEPASLALFSIAVLLLPLFLFHTIRQERMHRKVIIPLSLMKNKVFASLCVAVFIVWGNLEAVQLFLTLFYQLIQNLSPLQTSLRFLPMVVTGTATNVLTGYLVKRVRADMLVMSGAAISAIAPLLMAVINPSWSYWACAFIAVACSPISADMLFTVAQLAITSVFPPETHGLAGGVFNTVANIGTSLGLAVAAVVASSVTMAETGKLGSTPESLMDGYRATFWLCFGLDIVVMGVIGFGLRKIGKVGIKLE